MPSRTEVVEDFLAQIEERFYKTLKAEDYLNYLGGSVRIVYTTAPRVTVEITEAKKPGPKVGQKFKPKIGPNKEALKAMNEDTEDF